tara:strand:+ start:633 stop:908 length:276 start_codon:yes stop_codon:yes gene_type:complete
VYIHLVSVDISHRDRLRSQQIPEQDGVQVYKKEEADIDDELLEIASSNKKKKAGKKKSRAEKRFGNQIVVFNSFPREGLIAIDMERCKESL